MKDGIGRIGVLGAGSWGTTLANLVASKGYGVDLWAYESEVVSGIERERRNPLYAPELELPTTISATDDLERAVAKAEAVLFVIPSQLLRSYLKRVAKCLPPHAPLIVCSKGIERRTLATMEQVFQQELSEEKSAQFCVLSGPSFASEVADKRPTNVTVAARNVELAKRVQALMSTREFRVYTSDDVTGVQMGGALKNLIAIVAGGSDEWGLGSNTRAAIITRGLAEITRLAVAMEARPETLLGLAGVGDLVLTCTSDLSRNRQVGRLLARGHSLETIKSQMNTVAEGVATAESAYHLAQKLGVDMPITEQLYQVLYEGKSVVAGMSALQDRALKDEWIT